MNTNIPPVRVMCDDAHLAVYNEDGSTTIYRRIDQQPLLDAILPSKAEIVSFTPGVINPVVEVLPSINHPTGIFVAITVVPPVGAILALLTEQVAASANANEEDGVIIDNNDGLIVADIDNGDDSIPAVGVIDDGIDDGNDDGNGGGRVA